MTQTEALKLALEALNHYEKAGLATVKTIDAITAIKEVLAQPEQQEPCEYMLEATCTKCGATESGVLKFTAQPQRKPLTDEQIKEASLKAGMQEHYMGFHSGFIRFARAIESAHGIKENT